jgi:RNA polymerase sigma-70 factor (ECF subfamily)
MFQPSLEKLFDRYRRRGDAAALGAVFDRTSAELHRLALHLVRDASEAEDVLQNTYLAAIESAPSYDASRPLVPWLVGILANQAALARRRARREVEPDRLERREEPPPSETADLAEFSSKLGEALSTLPEPYAEVLRLHLAEGKKSVDIARELGREPGTVRMQVHRGLDLLRRALPAGFAAGSVAVGLSTTARAALRERVVGEAVARGATLSAASGGTALVLAKAAGAAALALGLWAAVRVAWPSQPSSTPDSAREVATNAAAGETPDHASSETGDSRSALSRAASPPLADAENGGGRTLANVAASSGAEPAAAPSAGPWLVGAVHLPAHLAADAVTLEVRALGRGRVAETTPLTAHADGAGAFRIDLAPLFAAATVDNPLEELVVRAEHVRTTRGETRVRVAGVAPQKTYTAELALAEAAVLIGRAFAPRESDAQVEVGLVSLRDGAPCLPLADRARVAADGAFLLRANEARECLFVAYASGAVPYSRRIRLQPGAPLDVGEIALDPGLALDGTVTRAGEPVEHALVGITAPGTFDVVLPLFGARLGWRDGALHRSGAMVETDALGRFVARGFEAGSHRVEVVRAEGLRGVARLSPAVAVECPGSVALEVASAKLELEVLDADRRPARGEASLAGAAQPARLDADGRVRLEVEPFARASVTIESPGHRTETFEFDAPGPGETRGERILLLRDSLLANLDLEVAEHGDEELELDFEALDESGAGTERAAKVVRRVRANAGRARLEGLPIGRWRVRAFVGNSYRHYAELLVPLVFEVELAPAATATRAIEFRRGGRVRVELVDEDGARLAGSAKLFDATGRELTARFVARGAERVGSTEGRLSELAPNDVYPNLAPGEYRFEFAAPGRIRVERRVTVEAGRVVELSIPLSKTE